MKNETVPNSNVIEEMVRDIVRPTLETIAKDMGGHLNISISVMEGASEATKASQLFAGANQLPPLCGNVRLRFREVSSERLLMHCETLFVREQAVNNCSGFYLKAEMLKNVSKRTAWTIRYGLWDWAGWI